MNKAESLRVPAESLREFCCACFEKLGLGPAHANITADHLIFANLRGVDSHGVIRLKVYAERLRAGGTNARAQPQVVRQGEAEALIDADNGVGQVPAVQAMKLAIAKAKKVGVGLVGVRNSNHFGAAAFYAMMALEEKMIGFAATNSGPTMAPAGGREARLGNNPLAIAIPARKRLPIVLDMATGAVAWGKIFMAQQEKKKIPLSWALDKNGLPTDDPDKAADKGLIQPLGGYKGYGLSLVIDIFTGILCGSAFSVQVKSLYRNVAQPSHCAHMCAAVRIERFMPFAQFCRRVDEIIDLMHSCPHASSVERIYVPGEIEHETQRRRLARGIPLNPVLKKELAALGDELGISPPF